MTEYDIKMDPKGGDALNGFVLLRMHSCERTINSGIPKGTENAADYEGTDSRLFRMDTFSKVQSS